MHRLTKVPKKWRFFAIFLVFLLIPSSFLYSQTSGGLPNTLGQYERQKLVWVDCYEYFQCTDLSVPIDYAALATGRFSIRVIRYRANNQKNKIGTLVINPGGPGASGVNFAHNAEAIFSPAILSRYDVVGFDPRGVGDSSAIHCLTDKETDASYAADSKPDSPTKLATLVKEMKSYVAKCEAFTPNILHFGTSDSARDMDLLRSALGEKKLNYLGVSYGTYLGTLYASLFPSKVGRMVLDGAVSPRSTTEEQNISQAVGFDFALRAFIDDCYKSTDCPLTKPLTMGISEVISLFAQAARQPFLGTADRPVTESMAVLGVASSLYDRDSGWPQLKAALAEAKVGNGSTLLRLDDQYTQRNSKGVYVTNETDAAFVIDCLDSQRNLSTSEIIRSASQFASRAPIFGPYLAYSGLACQFFTGLKAKDKPITSISTAPIVIVGTTRDPATPYQWALDLQKTLRGSRLVTLEGDGHTGYGRGSLCVDDTVNKYLLSGSIPKANLTCKVNS